MKNSQRGFLATLLLIVVAVLLIGGGVYVYTQSLNVPLNQANPASFGSGQGKIDTKVTTVDWKTYTNEQYGFEIKYPPQWIVTGTNSVISITAQANTSGLELHVMPNVSQAQFMSRVAMCTQIRENTSAMYRCDPKGGIPGAPYYDFFERGIEVWITDFYDSTISRTALSTFTFTN